MIRLYEWRRAAAWKIGQVTLKIDAQLIHFGGGEQAENRIDSHRIYNVRLHSDVFNATTPVLLPLPPASASMFHNILGGPDAPGA